MIQCLQGKLFIRTVILAVVQNQWITAWYSALRKLPQMSQTFKSSPRQIGFKPNSVRMAPVQASKADPAQAQIRQLKLQQQQLLSKIRIQEERLGQLKIPATRQSVETQLQQLRKQNHLLDQELLKWCGQARLARLKALQQTLPGEAAELADTLRLQLAELDAIYRVHIPLPTRLLPIFEDWSKSMQGLHATLLKGKAVSALEWDTAEARLSGFGRELWPAEQELLQQWLIRWRQALPVAAPVESSQVPTIAEAADDDFQVLSFESQGPLELSFDLSQRKSVVRNQLGITLNQPKQSYQEYLETGFGYIDQTVGSQFTEREPLYAAVEAFLEAISLDRSRYEAYFGLGYLYSLVKDLNHAIYFLDLAWRISGDAAIQDMIQKVRSACGAPAMPVA